jgi:hypothetical protein
VKKIVGLSRKSVMRIHHRYLVRRSLTDVGFGIEAWSANCAHPQRGEVSDDARL